MQWLPSAATREKLPFAIGLGAHADNVFVVHPGVDDPGENPPSADGRVDGSIVMVSRLEEQYKGHDVLLRALPLVQARVPNVHLHVVGDGSLRSSLESYASALGVADVVIVHGRVSDRERDAIMSRSVVFAMPSGTDALGSGEGFGIVYIEAGAQGLPVVAGVVAGALDAVVDGETGLLVDPANEVAVAEALTSLLIDESR